VPTFESSTADRQIGNTPLYWSYDAALEGLSRREPNFVTADVVGRFDTTPRLTAPLQWHGWTLRPQISVENTFYTDRLVSSATGIGQPADNAVDRRALLSEVELRPPALERLFERPFLHHNLKHTFEPQIVYRRVAGVGNFANILRFDARDILSDTNEIEYGFATRVYAKRIPKGTGNCAGIDRAGTSKEADASRAACDAAPAREVVTWEVAQKYFFDPNFGGALVNGRRNVFTTTAEFTGIAFLTEPRLFSPVISRLRARSANADIEWHLDYDPRKGRISSSMAFLTYRFFKDFTVGGAHAFLRSPGEVVTSTPIATQPEFNQYRLLLQYGRPNKSGINAAATLGYDVNLNFLQYSAYQLTYNWECCGLSFEYRRFALAQVRNENQFRFALTLANVGTFGTLRKQERLF
jgi:LPS-assembly protein